MPRLKSRYAANRRTVFFGLWFTPGEADELRHRAAAVGISRPDFVRARTLDRPLPKRRPEVTRLLFAALAAIGNNVNQLARIAHMDGLATVEQEAASTMAELRETVARLIDRE